MAPSWTVRSRAVLHAGILDAAVDEVVTSGWRGLRMQAVADRAGVSRQTLNNEFGSKTGLARALVLHVADRYCDRYDRVLAGCADLEAAVRAGVDNALAHAAADEVFRAVLTPDGSDTFLPLYTRHAEPLIALFLERMTGAFHHRWPELDGARLTITVDALTRLILSHMLTPTRSADQVADELVALVVPFLRP